MRLGIIGGGVIGLAAGWFLRGAGAEVTIVERAAYGEAASKGNAGWITPALSTPIPAPGVMRQAIRWLGKPDSPFLIRPRLDLGLASWCWQFWRSTSHRRYREGTQALLALNDRTLELYDELQSAGVAFEMHNTGLLFVATDEGSLHEYSALFDTLRDYGYRGEVRRVDGARLAEIEPALVRNLAGGIHAVDERHVDPETLTRGLAESFRARGGVIVEQTEVTALRPQRGGTWIVETTADAFEFDKVLVAAGAWTASVLRTLAPRMRLEAAKGYSLTATGSGLAPRHALYFADAKIGCSPFRDKVRIAGTLELAGLDLTLNATRLGSLRRATSRYLESWEPNGAVFEWAGLRPMAPDGLPYIGPVPSRPGLYVATGHAMLGVTLAPATGECLASLMVDETPPARLQPFRLDR